MITAPTRIFTWVDIEQHLADLLREGEWPTWLLAVDPYWDSAEFSLEADTTEAIFEEWLRETFGARSVVETDSGLSFRLDGTLRGQQWSDRRLPIAVQYLAEAPRVRFQPRWRQENLSRATELRPNIAVDAGFKDLDFFAFHSYKGGVGRTLHAVAAARAMAKRGVKVLLVDGDLEAPGISWMYSADGRRADFAYEDFLSLIHSSTEPAAEDAVSIAATYLANQELNNIVVMPSRRSLSIIEPARIDPANLAADDPRDFVVSEAIAAVARSIGAAVVIVDLRAGATELSSPILLDPRVFRVFVSTVSAQSIDGTEQIIRSVGQRIEQRLGMNTALIITQYRESGQEPLLSDAANLLRNAVSGVADEAGLVLSEPLFSPFRETYLGLPRDWSSVLAVAGGAELEDVVSPLADLVGTAATLVGVSSGDEPAAGLQTEREQLERFSSTLAFAETAGDTEFLPTDSSEKLVASHRSELPLSVVVGAKGAGKTFTYLQMAFREDWQSFASAVGIDGVQIGARFVPVFASQNLNAQARTRVDELRELAAASGTAEKPLSMLSLKDEIQDALDRGDELNERAWRRLWLWCFARSAGIECSPETAEVTLAQLDEHAPYVFLIDGLEDLLREVNKSSVQQRALRVLLTDCMEWFRSLRNPSLGVVIFARRDLVQAAITQNTSQFLALYQDYELKWNATEALRLAAWVVARSTTRLQLTQDDILSANSEALAAALVSVWGDKMGSPKSREARSDTWFLAALSDFNGQIQARDIVIFIKESVSASLTDTRWPDRLLAPYAMREALSACSTQKISAISEESPAVGDVLRKLSALPDEQRQIPFTREQVDLDADEIELLTSNGIVFTEDNNCWIPEIYRHGLRFSANGRPRILAIANLVRKRNPLD